MIEVIMLLNHQPIFLAYLKTWINLDTCLGNFVILTEISMLLNYNLWTEDIIWFHFKQQHWNNIWIHLRNI